MSDNFIQENSEIITLRAMANVFMPEALDPVGQEDDDVDNDGDSDKSDEYLKKRRKAVGSAIDKRKKKLKEATAAAHTSDDDDEEIVEKKVKNKVTINPQMESKGYYDPMEDDEFDHDEAEKNRGVSGKNNPKGGKRLYKKPKRKSVEEAVNTPTSDYNRAKQLNSPASPTGGQRPPGSMDPRNTPGIDSLTGVKQASAGTGPKLKPGSGLGGGKPVYPKGQEPKPTGAQLPNLQTAGYEPEGEQIEERSVRMDRMKDRYLGNPKETAKRRAANVKNIRKGREEIASNIARLSNSPGGVPASVARQAEKVGVRRDHFKGAAKAALKNSYEPEGEQLQEKPGDGYLGPTVNIGGKEYGIPNPIRIAQDAHDTSNRANQRRVDRINKILPGSASMPPYKNYNSQNSTASQNLFGYQKQSFEPEGEMVDERYKGSKHRPPAGWKPYGGYEKGPVEVDATAKRIDAIRKSIKIKKKKED